MNQKLILTLVILGGLATLDIEEGAGGIRNPQVLRTKSYLTKSFEENISVLCNLE